MKRACSKHDSAAKRKCNKLRVVAKPQGTKAASNIRFEAIWKALRAHFNSSLDADSSEAESPLAPDFFVVR